MKTKMKRQGSNELPRFAVGALAIAGASAANAATVQITFTGSYISTTGGNHIVTDFGGDGVANVMAGGGLYDVKLLDLSFYPIAFATGSVGNVPRLGIGSLRQSTDGSVSARGLASITFRDANIRNNAATIGWLDISAVASHPGEKILTVHRLIFDNQSATAPTGLTSASTGIPAWGAVPEPSSLGLLALGAGGLLARRRRAA